MEHKTVGFKKTCPICGECEIEWFEAMCITCRKVKEYLEEYGDEDDILSDDYIGF